MLKHKFNYYHIFPYPLTLPPLPTKVSRATDSGTLYISYDASVDELYLSGSGYGSAAVLETITGLLGASGSVDVIIGGGDDVVLTSGQCYLDNFEVSAATLIGWPPATDLDSNGFIGLGDLEILFEYWLQSGPEGNIDGLGDVDLDDFGELESAW